MDDDDQLPPLDDPTDVEDEEQTDEAAPNGA